MLILPSGIVLAERSFSGPKRINACYRSTQRLFGLSLISIVKGHMELSQKSTLYEGVIEKQGLSTKSRIDI